MLFALHDQRWSAHVLYMGAVCCRRDVSEFSGGVPAAGRPHRFRRWKTSSACLKPRCRGLSLPPSVVNVFRLLLAHHRPVRVCYRLCSPTFCQASSGTPRGLGAVIMSNFTLVDPKGWDCDLQSVRFSRPTRPDRAYRRSRQVYSAYIGHFQLHNIAW